MRLTKLSVSILVLALALFAGAGCSREKAGGTPAPAWSPAPVTGVPMRATTSAILPDPTRPVAAAAGPTDAPTRAATRAATPKTATTLATAVASPTRDPHLLIITEQDVARQITQGAAEASGATMDSPDVKFRNERMTFSAARVTYGFITVDSLVVVGKLVAVDGKLQFETESVSPRGLVTAMVPTLANQALAQYTSKWYVEEVKTLDGRLELRIR